MLPPHCHTGVDVTGVEGLVVVAAHDGWGQIAGTDFDSPQRVAVDVLVLRPAGAPKPERASGGSVSGVGVGGRDEEGYGEQEGLCIGVLWHALGSFSLFSRLPLPM